VARDQAENAPLRRRQQARHLGLARRRRRCEMAAAIGAIREHALYHEGVEVHVGVQRGAEALDCRDGGAAPVCHAAPARPPALEAEHGADEHGEHGAAEPMVPRERVAQPVRQRQHPLADRQPAEHAVDEMRRQFGHPPPTAGRAETPSLARERDQHLVEAVAAAKPREAAGHRAAGDELAQLPFHKPRHALTAAPPARLRQEALQVFADDRSQQALLGMAANIRLATATQPIVRDSLRRAARRARGRLLG